MKDKITEQVSGDGNYRYVYKRVWKEDLPLVMFICLNPTKQEPLDKLKELSKEWGYGGFFLCNLFAYKTDNFMSLTTGGSEKAVGKHNDKWLKKIYKRSLEIVFAWGINGKTYRRCDEVVVMFPKAKTIGKYNGVYPEHPLYINGYPKLNKYKAL